MERSRNRNSFIKHKTETIVIMETKLGKEHDTSEFLHKKPAWKVHRNDTKTRLWTCIKSSKRKSIMTKLKLCKGLR